ncbi:dihydrolipoamide acetyltransferase family protein [Haloplanus aerogenes]|uniref:2-oxo acid dehydrogenase subunit E2 n=1 Tax=Haloplanus aerogenes TaxID=660522 RepID=A0A3M0CXX2_9EURY|nr:dihydrolipoamide acetyltransferase family protein [Haloplanus aerogenes]AZH23919.1 2-oxo acid dehydrogenase subunit E2 [Haloplanus aerogenes]RMB13320.1 pyruvate dehydrogenase E2 component (dihydrolipoamide acetyltransferase) [Haloplanus aerogenes]
MTVETFKLPDVGEGVAEGELVRWLVDVGEEIDEDQPLAEVETDKALVDLPSPFAGTVTDRHAEEGEMVPVGSALVSIEVDGDDAAEEASADVPETAGADDQDTADAEVTADTDADTAASPPDGRVFAPPHTRRLARELGVDIGQVAGSGPGGRVTDTDVRAAAEAGDGTPTPRAADADATSVMREHDGTTDLDDVGEHRESADAVEQAAAAAGQLDETRDRTLAAPATRRLADELGVDLDAVPTDEARDGVAFVTPAMVHEYAERQRETAAAASAEPSDEMVETAADEPAREPSPVVGPQPGDRIPYRGVRRSIGEQMERSKYTAPHVTHTDEVDVTTLVETKADLEPYAAEEGVDLTYLPFVMRAVTRALAEFPQVNATLDEDEEVIVCHDEYNVGVATATDAGLMVPVIEDADEKGLLELAAEAADKADRARDRSISREEMQGGTFTITNVGVIGGEYATPIVNYPEVAILALGRIAERPRVIDGEVVPRYTLPLSLSVDHRVVDGAVAARFTNRVMELLSAPARLLVG